MNEQQLHTETQARRLATFLEAAMSDQDGFWLPREPMIDRIREIVQERPLTGLRFLRGVATAAGMEWEPVPPEVWLRVADLLEAETTAARPEKPENWPTCPSYDGVPEYGGPCWTCQNDPAHCPVAAPATAPLPETGELRGDTQALAPAEGKAVEMLAQYLPGALVWGEADDALLAEWLDSQDGETT